MRLSRRCPAGFIFLGALLAICGPSRGEPLTCDELKTVVADMQSDYDKARALHEGTHRSRRCLEEVEKAINSAQTAFAALPEVQRGANGPRIEYPKCASKLAPLTLVETKARLVTVTGEEEDAWNDLLGKAPELTRVRDEFDAGCP